MLTSTVEENGRQFACEGEVVIFTCEVIGSLTLQWDSPLIPQISFPAGSTVSTSRPPSFIATLTSIAGSGINSNITSTLQVNASRTFARNDTTVECRNLPGVTEQLRFTVAGNSNQDTRTCYDLTQLSFYCIHVLTIKCCVFPWSIQGGLHNMHASSLFWQQFKLPQDAHRI